MNERRTDFELLRDFARHGDQSAFADLVRRHLDLVYATALRKVEDSGAAEELAQNVFGILARKSWQFGRDDSVAAWLYRTTLLEAREWLRGELRRRRRQQTAAELGTTMKTPDEQSAFRALIPMLDEALLSLREEDRTALLLRFYESQSLREVGASLGIREDAAQKRVAGALERLARFFQRRGFKTATTVTAAAALEHTTVTASASTAATVIGVASQVAPPALAGAGALLARVLGLTKTQTATVCVALAALPVGWQWQAHRAAGAEARRVQTRLLTVQEESASLRTELEQLHADLRRLNGSVAVGNTAAAQSAKSAQHSEKWKTRIRSQLMASDYQWPADSPFVRIPKSALRSIEVPQPILPPGVLKEDASEILGCTPQEHAQIEDALRRHFAAVDRMVEASLYETNGPSRLRVPGSAIASQVWELPALGEEAKASGDELKAALRNILGEQRWPLVQETLSANGTDTLRRILNLDASTESQEFGVWIREKGGKLLVGYGWSGGFSSFSSGGLALEHLGPGAAAPKGMNLRDFLGVRNLPEPLVQRAMDWVQQQAATRLGRETGR